MKRWFLLLVLNLMILLLVTACSADITRESVVTVLVPTETLSPEAEPSSSESPTATVSPSTETPQTESTMQVEIEESLFMEPLSTEPQRIEFQAEDSAKLVGIYYPAAVNPAPVVVLLHWARGDKSNWTKLGMVQWLTNRGIPLEEGGISQEEYNQTYPPMPEGVSFGVFTFDFRNFGESESADQWNPEGWRMDAQAAVRTAQSLPGVDPVKIATLGSSIGADASALGCLAGCTGVISLSPGNYLDIDYADAVLELETMGVPVLCFAAEGDGESAPTCRNANSTIYQFVIYPGNAHGNDLLTPGRDPDIGRTIQDFLFKLFGVTD